MAYVQCVHVQQHKLKENLLIFKNGLFQSKIHLKLALLFGSFVDVPIDVIFFLISGEHFSPSVVSLFKSPTTVSIEFDSLNLNARPSSISIDFEGIVIAFYFSR